MSRFKDWTNTQQKVIWKIEELHKVSFSKALAISKKRINAFYPNKKDNSSYTDRILYVKKNYSEFINFLKSKQNES